MKKLISYLLVLAVALSLWACAEQTAESTTNTELTVEDTEPTKETAPDYSDPAVKYGHINQLEPVNGVYQIWNEVGVLNMANHLDGTFELLCDVDMLGAVLSPLGTAEEPFTGEIKGRNCTISNFTLQGTDETNFGFIGVNQGAVRNLILKDVTLIVGDKVQNVGAFAGINEGAISRCTIHALTPMEVKTTSGAANCGGMVGQNFGDLSLNVADANLIYTAPAAANIGGMAGTNVGGKVEYNECYGSLDITGDQVAAGLYAGVTEDSYFLGCWFVGEVNTINGNLFNNYAGQETNATYENCLWRDNDIEPLSDNVRKLRQRVVDKMKEMGTIEWTVPQVLAHNCKCGTSGVCVGSYNPDYTYYGMPYKHGSGSLLSFKYVLDENNVVADWVYDLDTFNGYDVYIGSMCVSATEMAWWTVSNTANHLECEWMLPDNQSYGVIPVGTGWWENATLSSLRYTKEYHDQTTQEIFFEALAQIRMGDCLVTRHKDGDHVIMAATDAVILRNQDGSISHESFITTHEQQGSAIVDQEEMTWTSWRLDYKRTFSSIWNANGLSGYIPVTCEELLTGEMETPECTMLDGADGQLGMTIGTVKANYFLDAVQMVITDSQGNVVMDQIMFPKAGKPADANTRLTSLSYIDSYDMVNFCTPLQNVQLEKGETYTYTITAYLATDDVFQVKTDSFVYGSAG